MRFSVDQIDQHSAARGGAMVLGDTALRTPVFMPVATSGSLKGLWPDDLDALGYRIVLSNTYHLYVRPGISRIRQAGGLHRFMAWDRAILTDSGGFQVFSLATLRKVEEGGVRFRSHLDGAPLSFTPAGVVASQVGLGSDILMPLDVCTDAPRRAGKKPSAPPS